VLWKLPEEWELSRRPEEKPRPRERKVSPKEKRDSIQFRLKTAITLSKKLQVSAPSRGRIRSNIAEKEKTALDERDVKERATKEREKMFGRVRQGTDNER